MAPRSRAQLETKLRDRQFPDDVTTAVLDRMTEVGLVDDKAYAAMVVRQQQATRGLAKRAIGQELRTKGIGDELVGETLDSIDAESERVRAEELVRKRLPSVHGLDAQVQWRRLCGMLARKGYPPSVCYAVVRDALASAVEHQPD